MVLSSVGEEAKVPEKDDGKSLMTPNPPEEKPKIDFNVSEEDLAAHKKQMEEERKAAAAAAAKPSE